MAAIGTTVLNSADWSTPALLICVSFSLRRHRFRDDLDRLGCVRVVLRASVGLGLGLWDDCLFQRAA